MNKSQKKKKKRSQKFLNEYYSPAIKFQAFDPRPPEMRGISNAHKKIIDQMLDKNSWRKQKSGSISGNRENVTGEDPIDVGTNSMGHPVTKPMRRIETENLSENMNISQSIPDQIFDKRSLRKQKFGSISENQQNIKRKNVTGEDPINVGTTSIGHPVTKPMRMSETEN